MDCLTTTSSPASEPASTASCSSCRSGMATHLAATTSLMVFQAPPPSATTIATVRPIVKDSSLKPSQAFAVRSAEDFTTLLLLFIIEI